VTNVAHSRRDVRLRARIAAVLTIGKRSFQTMTEDVSLRGVFVHTDSPPSMRQLVRVEVTLPSGAKLTLNAMVVFVLPVANEYRRPPGVGLQLYGVGREQEALWQSFIRELAAQQPEAGRLAVELQTPPAPDPIRRQHPRLAVRMRVQPRNVQALLEMWTRDVSRGGMFIETEHALGVGELLEVDVVHPQTGATFTLSCVVRRIARGSAGRGLGVEIRELDDDRRAAFQDFAMSSIPELDEALVLVADDDPSLA
jgi:Tfp pilus assembly protein PilZ